MISLRDLRDKRFVQRTAGTLLATYTRLIALTTRVVYDPPDLRRRIEGEMPVILAFWHGQHFLVPLLKAREDRVKVLISRHRDGEINAIAAESFGIGTVRGSGDHGVEFRRKGGVSAFKMMLRDIMEGYSMALTADVPKVSRVAGLGIIMLARASGRPIVPVAIASSRFRELDNWDRSVIPLPFGRTVIALGAPVRLSHDADEPAMEQARSLVELNLNEATQRAYSLAGRMDVVARHRPASNESSRSEAGLG
jgi:lysophospholipid acyltransferase (LPLAT)-like uncharacterized protein